MQDTQENYRVTEVLTHADGVRRFQILDRTTGEKLEAVVPNYRVFRKNGVLNFGCRDPETGEEMEAVAFLSPLAVCEETECR